MKLNLEEHRLIENVISKIYEKYYFSYLTSSITFDIFASLIIIAKASKILKEEPAVLQINSESKDSDFVIVGDIHGNLESLVTIFKKHGDPSKTRYLFLGDYVDRGENSCEVIILLYAYKCLYPKNIYLIRGNHEFYDMNECYGFKEECEKRMIIKKKGKIINRGSIFFNRIVETFKELPICAILNDTIFCVHGGITDLIKNIDDLKTIEKVGTELSEKNQIQAEFLWNDPDNNISDYDDSPRGYCRIFGEDAIKDFLTKLGFDLVIRGHQNEMEGFNWPFEENKYVLTVFSSSDYCGTGNDGGIAIISEKGDITTIKIGNISDCANEDLSSDYEIDDDFVFLAD